MLAVKVTVHPVGKLFSPPPREPDTFTGWVLLSTAIAHDDEAFGDKVFSTWTKVFATWTCELEP
jgi:hypothetical protein